MPIRDRMRGQRIYSWTFGTLITGVYPEPKELRIDVWGTKDEDNWCVALQLVDVRADDAALEVVEEQLLLEAVEVSAAVSLARHLTLVLPGNW